MSRLSPRQVRRLLAVRATAEPPAFLADRIKAEIPDSVRLDRQALQPGHPWLMPPKSEGLRPSWLAAASLLLVAGVGVVAANIPTQPDEVWKWLALSGVVYIDDIVVTAPPAGTPARTAAAGASNGARPPGGANALEGGVTIVVVGEGERPRAGVAVRLERVGPGPTPVRTAATDAGGTAAFRAVPPASYRVLVSAPGIAPAEATVTVSAERTATRVILHVHARPGR